MILESDNFAEEHTKLSLSVLTHDYDFEPIRSLYYLGILLKRPIFTRKYLKSGLNTYQPRSSITPENISHIWGALRRWKEPGHAGTHSDDEKGVELEEI
jgi:hypothetical protein